MGKTSGEKAVKRQKAHKRYRRRHFGSWDRQPRPGPYLFPAPLSSPSDLCVVHRFMGCAWTPLRMDVLAPRRSRTPQSKAQAEAPLSTSTGLPPGLEFLAISDHLYVQSCFRRDFPETIPIYLHHSVVNRYEVISGDTRRRNYYAVATIPCCTGWLYGYRPFRLYLMNSNLDIVMKIHKVVSCRLFWCWGGFGTSVQVTGAEGQVLGSFTQRLTFFRPRFDLYDAEGKRIFIVRGPPVIPCPLKALRYLWKFKLLQEVEEEEEGGGNERKKKRKVVGVFLESHYGLGGRNTRNSLRVGFPRDIPYQHKGVILAALFVIFFTYYELGDEYAGRNWCHQNYRSLLRINPFNATRLQRPYGYVRGKCNPWYALIVVAALGYLLYTAISRRWISFDVKFILLQDKK